jgi:hypothetical protein
MKTYISEINKKQKEHPCNNCQVGWGNYCYGKDDKGEYIEMTTCADNCKHIEEFNKSI